MAPYTLTLADIGVGTPASFIVARASPALKGPGTAGAAGAWAAALKLVSKVITLMASRNFMVVLLLLNWGGCLNK
jgi:hypothetical protein